MPESPDFDVMAIALVASLMPDDQSHALAQADVAEQLRDVWNARGAADIAALEGAHGAEVPPSMKTLDRAIRALDR